MGQAQPEIADDRGLIPDDPIKLGDTVEPAVLPDDSGLLPRADQRPRSPIGYKITATGQYHGVEGGKRTVKFFDPIEVVFPEIVEFVQGRKKVVTRTNGVEVESTEPLKRKAHINRVAQHLIMRYYGPAALRQRHADYRGIRILEITTSQRIRLTPKQINLVTDMAIKDMGEAELMQFCLLKDIDIVLSNYSNLANQKLAVAQMYKSQLDAAAALVIQRPTAETELLRDPTGVGADLDDLLEM